MCLCVVPAAVGVYKITDSGCAVGPIYPPIQCVPGSLLPGVTRPGREADDLPLSCAEREWSCTVTLPYAFMACTGTILLLPYPS